MNRAIDIQRKAKPQNLDSLGATVASKCIAADTTLFEEAEYRKLLVFRALDVLKSSTPDASFQAAWFQLVDGLRADEAAARLNISVNSAYLAKSRLLSRLRLEIEDFLE